MKYYYYYYYEVLLLLLLLLLLINVILLWCETRATPVCCPYCLGSWPIGHDLRLTVRAFSARLLIGWRRHVACGGKQNGARRRKSVRMRCRSERSDLITGRRVILRPSSIIVSLINHLNSLSISTRFSLCSLGKYLEAATLCRYFTRVLYLLLPIISFFISFLAQLAVPALV